MTFRTSRTRAIWISAAAATAVGASLAVVPAVTASAAGTTAAGAGNGDAQAAANKALILNFENLLFNDYDLSVIDQYVSPNYTQHNPTVANGPDALRQLVIKLHAADPQLHITAEHAVAEGDLVVVQNNTGSGLTGPGQTIFDMYRVDGGKIVEHWDVIEAIPTTTTSGNDLFSELSRPSGDSAPAPVTAADKGLVLDYVTGLMQDHNLSAVSRYVDGSIYQHDPTLPNGSAALAQYYSALLTEYPSFSVQVAQVVADGDLVAVHAHLKDAPSDAGQAVTYLFRVRHGKIVEQWDSTQNVPATSANNNSMF